MSYYSYRLDEIDEGDSMQAYLLEKTGQRTVPNVWIRKFQFIPGPSRLFTSATPLRLISDTHFPFKTDQQHIGGNDDFQAANRSGRVKKLLTDGSKP